MWASAPGAPTFWMLQSTAHCTCPSAGLDHEALAEPVATTLASPLADCACTKTLSGLVVLVCAALFTSVTVLPALTSLDTALANASIFSEEAEGTRTRLVVSGPRAALTTAVEALGPVAPAFGSIASRQPATDMNASAIDANRFLICPPVKEKSPELRSRQLGDLGVPRCAGFSVRRDGGERGPVALRPRLWPGLPLSLEPKRKVHVLKRALEVFEMRGCQEAPSCQPQTYNRLAAIRLGVACSCSVLPRHQERGGHAQDLRRLLDDRHRQQPLGTHGLVRRHMRPGAGRA